MNTASDIPKIEQSIAFITKEALLKLETFKENNPAEYSSLEFIETVKKNIYFYFLMQILNHRSKMYSFLTRLMVIESIVLLGIIILSSIILNEKPLLKVPSTTLHILVGGTIIQVSAMVIVMVKSLFPDDISSIINNKQSAITTANRDPV